MIRTISIVGLVALLIGRAVASIPPDLIAALDAPSLEQRDRATAQLLGDDSISQADIERALAEDRLSWEQRLRLTGLGLALFAREPRAGLGVQFGTPVEGGAPLNAVIAGFPAAAVLRPGDIVRSIDGQPVINTAHMGAIILSHDPGDSLELVIDRPTGPPPRPGQQPPTQRLTLNVPLGRFEDLNNGLPSPDRLWAAYRQRLARTGADRPPPMIGTGLSPLAWLHAEGYDEQPPAAPKSRLKSVPAWRTIKLAGQARSSVSGLDLRRGDESDRLRRATIAIRADGVYDEVEETLAAYRAIVGRLTQLASHADTKPREPAQLKREHEERAELETELVKIVRLLQQTPGISGP